MRRRSRLARAAVLGAIFVGAARVDATAAEVGSDVKQAAEAGNRFAVRLYDAVRRPGENAAVGPMCVSSALTLVAAGAKGETRAEMVRVLGWEGAPGDVDAEWGGLVRAVSRVGKGIELRSANGVWVRQGVTVRREFKDAATGTFGAEVGSWDGGDPEAGAKKINNWVERNTKGRIREIVNPRALAGGDVVVGSTTYFKGKWATPFEPGATADETFRVDEKKSVRVRMMHRRDENATYGEAADYQVLWLPYGSGAVSMAVVLPKRADGLEALEREVAAKGVAGLAKPAGEEVTADVSLPRFTVRGRYDLREMLAGMGMTRAFGAGADFSGMVDGPGRVTSVKHEAIVEVNEEGTEAAAAATGVEVLASIHAPSRHVTFKADHPFLFLIVHEPTGAVLFMGRVVDPSAGG